MTSNVIAMQQPAEGELLIDGELSAEEQTELDQYADHIMQLEGQVNQGAKQIRLQQADDLINAFKKLTGRTPFEATEDSAKQRFNSWIKQKDAESCIPFAYKYAWELIHLHRFCQKRPAALTAENISLQALIELSRPALITNTKQGEVDPEREKIVTAALAKLKKRKKVTAKTAREVVLADLEAAGKPVYKAPPAQWTVDKAESEIERLVNRIRLSFKRKPEDLAYLKRKLISEAENAL